MEPQTPKKYKKEERRLIQLYLSLPDGTDWDEFYKKNASRSYKLYKIRREIRAKRLWITQGIIEN